MPENFSKKENISPDYTPVVYCPNSWGRLEYGGKVYKAIKNEDVDNKILSSNAV